VHSVVLVAWCELYSMKSSQAKELNGGGELRERKSTSPCLLAILAFDRIAGLCKRHFNSNKGYTYANGLKSG
jgi:hypothetical protein